MCRVVTAGCLPHLFSQLSNFDQTCPIQRIIIDLKVCPSVSLARARNEVELFHAEGGRHARYTSSIQNLRLVEKAGNWLVYDVVVDGISLMNSYRGQFARVLTYASYETLVERMREKADIPMHARAE